MKKRALCFIETLDDIADYFVPTLAVILVLWLILNDNTTMLYFGILCALFGSFLANRLELL